MESVIGEVRMFAGNFAPLGWEFCKGQLVDISEYDALYTLLGTTYGGDGINNFGLPNLSSRVPVGIGQGAGMSVPILSGTLGGTETNTITMNTLPAHSHPLTGAANVLVSSKDGRKPSPVNNSLAPNGEMVYSSVSDGTQMAPAVVALSVGSAGTITPASLPNIKPVLAINFIISMYGIYPSQP